VAAPTPTHEHSSGSERGCPDVQTYSDQLDEPERDEWQRPKVVIELLECRAGMTVVDLGAGTGYFLRYLSEAVGREGRVLALDISPSSICPG
jgi:predicted methyltransferase